MIILGIHSVTHDPSAALLIDGKVVAAADEERFTRKKHAWGGLPVNAVNYCLDAAGIKPDDVDIVSFPWNREVLRKRRWKYFANTCRRRPRRISTVHFKLYKRQNKREKQLYKTLKNSGFDTNKVEIEFVDHHIAHAASAYYFSGFESAAILSIDGVGEVQTTIMAQGKGNKISIVDEVLKPDSLGLYYSAMTEYLGFKANDGEYKLMGMAPYGDPDKADLDGFVTWGNGGYNLNTDFVNCDASVATSKGIHYSKALVEKLGPPRTGNAIAPPYTHVAAATQKLFEKSAMHLVDHHLAPILKENGGRLAFAGGCALNVVFNRRLIEHPLVKELSVQPNAGDGGTSLGAAAWSAVKRGAAIDPMWDVQLGPGYTTMECEEALNKFHIPYEKPDDIIETTADLVAGGNAVAWFQGRLEWGPRALGNRSVIGNPGIKGQTNNINLRVKFREAWRPFCPSILAEWGNKVFDDSGHSSPFMTFCYNVKPEWREKIPEVVHVDGSARPQYVTKDVNPRYRAVIEKFHEKTGLPCVINTSLNRNGEPIVCSPEDAIKMFFGCGLEYLVLEDLLVRKKPV